MTYVKYGERVSARRKLLQKVCPDCQGQFTTVWVRQKRCPPCGDAKRAADTSKSIKANKLSKAPALEEIRGSDRNTKTRIVDVFHRPDYLWMTTFKVPYRKQASKNARFHYVERGPAVRAAVRNYEDMVAMIAKNAMRGHTLAHNKVWVSYFVEKPDNKSDAVNVVDTISDALKKALGVDDRWFCIDILDWRIKKTDQNIIIRVGQESAEHVLACSHCGEILPLDNFPKKKDGPFGRSRVCRPCKSIVDRHCREARRRLVEQEPI